jgi:hypothetical protein
MRNLANKIEDFSKCDDFSGEVTQLTDAVAQIIMERPAFTPHFVGQESSELAI